MSRFRTKLQIENRDDVDDGQWVLTGPLVYESDVAGKVITVPAGFHTDLASVPRVPIAYWLAGGTSNEAAAVHDFLYTAPHPVPRNIADAVLREASMVTGVPLWRRWLMWAAVRAFGGSHWDDTDSAKSSPT